MKALQMTGQSSDGDRAVDITPDHAQQSRIPAVVLVLQTVELNQRGKILYSLPSSLLEWTSWKLHRPSATRGDGSRPWQHLLSIVLPSRAADCLPCGSKAFTSAACRSVPSCETSFLSPSHCENIASGPGTEGRHKMQKYSVLFVLALV